MTDEIKLSEAPLGHTLSIVDGTKAAYSAFGSALWAEDKSLADKIKRLVFIRTSIVNTCPT